MRIYQCLTVAMITFCSSTIIMAEESEVMFFNGTIEAAKAKAKKESKLYFIEFHAKWCEPCKWMDEFTFTDATLASYIDKNYVPVKVDVENLDGFVWKQKYKVQYLPTIVVLNGNGALLGKYEKSMGAPDLLRVLKNHRSAAAGTAADDIVAIADNIPLKSTSTSEPKPAFINVYREPGLPKASEVKNKPKSEPKKLIPPSSTPASKPAPAIKSTRTEDPKDNNPVLYRVQIGVYSDATNVASEVSKLKKSFTQTVQVFNNKNKETNIVSYRITLGKFSTKEEALRFVQELKSKRLQGVVKHMSELEQKM